MLIKEEENLKLKREAAFRSTIKSIARVDRLRKQLALVQEKADKLSSRIIAKLNKEDRVTSKAPRNSSVVEPSAFDFLSPRNPLY